jgi:hypothetical protein
MLPLSEKTEINALQQISRHIVTGLKDGNKVMPLPRQASGTISPSTLQIALPKTSREHNQNHLRSIPIEMDSKTPKT